MKIFKFAITIIFFLAATSTNMYSSSNTNTKVITPILKIQFYDKEIPPIIWPFSLEEPTLVNGYFYSNGNFELIFEEALSDITISIYKEEQKIEERSTIITANKQIELFSLNRYEDGNYTVCISIQNERFLYGTFSIKE